MKVIPLPHHLGSDPSSYLIEAQWLVAVLEQHGVKATLLGHSLLGAIGELPAGGLLRLAVDEADHSSTQALIDQLLGTNEKGLSYGANQVAI